MPKYQAGRHFLQIPGPTNVPDRVLRAMDYPTMDHRSPEFADLTRACLIGMQKVFKTKSHVVIFPASGTGAWEAALVNTLSPGDKILTYETGQFSILWQKMARNLGFEVEFLPGDWRQGANASLIEEKLREDTEHKIRAVTVVHNDTATGITSNIPAVRKAIDNAKHPALLLVDTISSLASIDYSHDEWGVDVTVAGSQKGLMLPPGISFNAISEKALAAAQATRYPKSYWNWEEMIAANKTGYFPYTPATNILYGLKEALDMLFEEGLENVFARHARHAEATRAAVRAWGLEILATNPAEYSNVLTAVVMPEGFDEKEFRKVILDAFDMSLGTGLNKVAGKVFRIGHLGDFNDLTLIGTLAGVEMGLELAGVPHKKGGVDAAMAYLTKAADKARHSQEFDFSTSPSHPAFA